MSATSQITVAISSLEPRFRRLESQLKALIIDAARKLRLPTASCELYIVGDRIMLRNVHSYLSGSDFPRPDMPGKYMGEIIVNPDYIRRRGESLPHMVIHGFLHLAGYDHIKRGDRIRMETLERKLLGHGPFEQ